MFSWQPRAANEMEKESLGSALEKAPNEGLLSCSFDLSLQTPLFPLLAWNISFAVQQPLWTMRWPRNWKPSARDGREKRSPGPSCSYRTVVAALGYLVLDLFNMIKSKTTNWLKPLFGDGEGRLLPTAPKQFLTDTPADFHAGVIS